MVKKMIKRKALALALGSTLCLGINSQAVEGITVHNPPFVGYNFGTETPDWGWKKPAEVSVEYAGGAEVIGDPSADGTVNISGKPEVFKIF